MFKRLIWRLKGKKKRRSRLSYHNKNNIQDLRKSVYRLESKVDNLLTHLSLTNINGILMDKKDAKKYENQEDFISRF
jgi:hypothetical protein